MAAGTVGARCWPGPAAELGIDGVMKMRWAADVVALAVWIGTPKGAGLVFVDGQRIVGGAGV